MKASVALSLAASLTLACSGSIEPMPGPQAGGPADIAGPSIGGSGGTGSPSKPPVGGPGGAAPTPSACKPADPLPAPLRRLTRREYNNTIADLIGDTSGPANSFSPEAGSTGFDTAADGAALNDKVVANYATAAETLARSAAKNLPALMGCDPVAMGEQACATQFIARFGRRVFRRPVSTDEQARYEALFASSRQLGGFAAGIEDVLRAFLMSPQFLYRVELGAGPGPRAGLTKLSPYEMATRLSLFFWAAGPDDELLNAAQSGGLNTVVQIKAQAQRLLMHEKGGRLVRDFYDQWLEADALDSLFRGATFTPTLAGSMRQEIQTYFDQLIRQRGAGWSELMTSRTSFVNDELARLYEIPGITGTQFREVMRQGDRHRGFLTMPGIMTLRAFPNEGSPIHRGKFIREQVMCEPKLMPLAGVVIPKIPPADAGKTSRQQLEEKTQVVEPCKTCHTLMNPPGFAFGKFDQVGGWHDVDDQKRPIDTAGTLSGTDVDGSFQGHVELIERLAGSKQANACVGKLWFRYAVARMETATDDCTMRDLSDAFTTAKGDVRSVILGLATSDAFLYR